MNKSEVKVLTALEKVGGFASAQEIYGLLQRSHESIGLTTVYRALQSLLEDKIVDVIRKDDGESIYRVCGESHHHHLVCKSCGKTVEIEGTAVEKWAKNIASEYGFTDVSHTAELFGTCKKCS